MLLVVCVVGALASAIEMGAPLLARRRQSPVLRHRHPGPVPAGRRGAGGGPLVVGRPSSPAGPSGRNRSDPTPRSAGIRRGPSRPPRGRAAVLAVGLAGVGGQRGAVDHRLLQRRRRLPRGLLPGRPRHGGRAVQRRLLTALRPGAAVSRSPRCATSVGSPMACTSGISRCSSTSTTPAPASPATRCSRVRVAVTLVVATASFYLVERPIRQGSLLTGWRAWAITPVAAVGTGGRPRRRHHRSSVGGQGPRRHCRPPRLDTGPRSGRWWSATRPP